MGPSPVATSESGVEAFFHTVTGTTPLFCLHHLPAQGSLRGLVVYVPPFAEEMNKSRRMAALQARRLCAAGFAVLQVDLSGCGDSFGDHGDASWGRWLTDVRWACDWLRNRHAPIQGSATTPPFWLWGLRAGGLLASQAAEGLDCDCGLLLWQPSLRGKLVLQQFLRLRLAGNLLDGASGPSMQDLRAQLAAGQTLDIAGYRLAPALAAALEQALLQPPATVRQTLWLELAAAEGAPLSPVSATALSSWREAGLAVDARTVAGPSFWQTVEIEEAPALLDATTAMLMSANDSWRGAS